MNKHAAARVFTTSLAIFAMLFGSGNLMLPLKVGLISGNYVGWGFLGFLLTGVMLPLLGLLTIIAFNGDYRAFFGRLGKIPGAALIFYCMLAIGPLVVMPRIVSLSYTLLKPILMAFYLPAFPQYVFSAFFLGLVFLATFRPGKLLGIIGRFLSPLKIASVVTIVAIGLLKKGTMAQATAGVKEVFTAGVEYGYGTLDLLGAIFFGAVIVSLLKSDTSAQPQDHAIKSVVKTAAYASIGAAALLGMIYAGMTYLGAVHGLGFELLNEGELFSAVSFRILGAYGAALIGLTVFLACFTTTVSLTAVVGEYTQRSLARGKISFAVAVCAVLAVCFVPASLDLSIIMKWSLPVIVASYPLFITITLCNAFYKVTGVASRAFLVVPTLITAAWIVVSLVVA